MNTQQVVANRILQLCQERNLSLHALARLSAVPPSTVKNIMYGVSKNPGIVTLKFLCDGFGIPLSKFFNTREFQLLEQEMQ